MWPDFGLPDVSVKDAPVGVDKVMVVLEPEMFEDFVHWLFHRTIKLRALNRFERTHLLVVLAVLQKNKD